MIGSFESGVIALVKSALSGQKEPIPDDMDWGRAVKLAKSHQIHTMIYYGAVNSGAEMPQGIRDHLEMSAFQNLAADRSQIFAVGEILNAFSENGIDHMPLKGTLLKPMYPKSELRVMSDADILIKPEQYDAIVPIMQKLGYISTGESDHEYIWRKESFLTIELHKRLIPSYNKDYYAYFGDGWQLAKIRDGSRYSMTDEDQFVYLFTHFAKHYRDGGIGIRHFVDLHIYLSGKPDLDFVTVENELKKLQLDEFYQNVRRTLKTWFEDAPPDEITDFITERIFGSGSYGTQDGQILASALKNGDPSSLKSTRVKRIWRLLFPTYKDMCDSFPSLHRVPFLLPLFWVARWFRALLFRRKNIGQKKREMDITTVEKMEDYRRDLHFVGLDFHFKE